MKHVGMKNSVKFTKGHTTWNKGKGLSLKESYEKNVIKIDNSCWSWKKSKDKYGYAIIHYVENNQGKRIKAHRASWILFHGEIPKELLVLHKCDNPICTNPHHLYLGNAKNNALDREKRNRRRINKGSQIKTSKLNEKKVKEIKLLISQKTSLIEIAKKFLVSRPTISRINCNRIWKHVT